MGCFQVAQIGMGAAIGQFESLLRAGSMAGFSDAELLERVIANDREIAAFAFEALLRRHGTMLMATCRGVLRNEHDAEDAFQTTFLTLARTGSLAPVREFLGCLAPSCGAAASERARAQSARRRVREIMRAELPAMWRYQPPCDAERDELHRLVHHEVDQLPDRYRLVLVLCDLQSETYEQAASKLRLPVGTVRSRLSRAREQLRSRIVRRGFALPGGAIATMLAGREASASVPPRLIASTLGSVKLTLAGASTLTASAHAIASSRWLGSSFGMASLGKSILALGLVALGVVFVAGNSVVHPAQSSVQSGADAPGSPESAGRNVFPRAAESGIGLKSNRKETSASHPAQRLSACSMRHATVRPT